MRIVDEREVSASKSRKTKARRKNFISICIEIFERHNFPLCGLEIVSIRIKNKKTSYDCASKCLSCSFDISEILKRENDCTMTYAVIKL